MTDTLETIDGSLLQHGPNSNRVYLMKAALPCPATLPADLVALAREKGYSKIFAKVRETDSPSFLTAGFAEEARIPGFYGGKDTALFMGFYLDPARSQEANVAALDDILHLSLAKEPIQKLPALNTRFSVRPCGPEDVEAMAGIYANVFPSYPFPIHDPAYLLKTMRSHIAYFGVETDGQWIAISSSEIDANASNVEMTDFATPPRWRRNRLAQHLLARMETEMKSRGIRTAYTIARALSAGMNVTFRKAGYAYGGRLKNNTQISGRIESMNVWYKPLA